MAADKKFNVTLGILLVISLILIVISVCVSNVLPPIKLHLLNKNKFLIFVAMMIFLKYRKKT